VSTGDLAEAIRGAASGGIERGDDGIFRQRYVFGPEFPAFVGHFPRQPVLPAVLQIMAAGLLVEAATGLSLLPIAIERAKFVTPIPPAALVEISCRRSAGPAGDLWDVRIVADGQPAASFFLELRAATTGR